MAILELRRMSFGDESATVMCPHCGGHATHHDRVDVFDRVEDKEAGAHVAVMCVEEFDPITRKVDHDVKTTEVRVSSDMTGNPSGRRNAVRVQLWCEGCRKRFHLNIVQHKGMTLLDVTPIIDPDKEEVDAIEAEARKQGG